ncbi:MULTISPECIES: branched-chain amino acid ABC transporter permease [unclassified Rhizobium]|uniref:branched-chain amino acid ABC transporter permease n=1 Tax=unclassified Rhizobium TaxID=2613769 RepID=UPI00104DB562|nr:MULTISPECIES: branched-chain amino acid ABC transporter permease [unclassified Rhizobium]MBB3397082.1 branched-chain amino acid transport system permease protein [Rhizobium sp. BK060]TCM76038.1 amino acid/amide ABC transporter membrane protein 1 (HAAT family) [Rhizobium sp. BK068]
MLGTAILSGLVLGGTYALVAMGLTLQYGIARIMNLAYGETIIAAAFLAYVMFSQWGVSPVLGLLIAIPAGFFLGYIVYGLLMRPLVARARDKAGLEIDSILATFGLLFVIQGLLLVVFGANFTNYSYLNIPVKVLGTTVAANRLLALVMAVVSGLGIYLVLTRTLWGTALRAVAVSPSSAALVGIDVDKAARTAFAIGGALAAAGGVVISMYQTFTATSGVVFTMKALIVVIMGGVGNILGALSAGLILGLVETFVATFVSPGLTLAATYLIFLGVLLWRPAGMFGRTTR